MSKPAAGADALPQPKPVEDMAEMPAPESLEPEQQPESEPELRAEPEPAAESAESPEPELPSGASAQPDPEPKVQPEQEPEAPDDFEPPSQPAAQPSSPSLEDRLSKLETRPADAWLERRLRVFEHTLTNLQTRQEQVERNSTGASGLLEQTLAEVKQIIAESDQRQREAMKSLRSAVVGMSSRMEGVESAIRAGGANPAESFAPEPVPEPASEPEPAEPIDSGHGARAEPQTGTVSFLAAARSAAKAAAEQPDAEREGQSVRLPRLINRLKRTHLLLIGGVALLVLFGSLGMVLSQTMSHAAAAPEAVRSAAAAASPVPRLVTNAEDARTEFAVGMKYLSGQGEPENARLAAFLFGRAAHEGNAQAEYELGSLFQRGVGVKADLVKAFRWYALAAEHGNRTAMQDLANAYAEGWGTAKDFAQAAGWYARAANLGYVDSAFNLAVLYERGAGVPQSLTEAYEWYAVGGAEGDSQAKSRADVLATQIAPDDLAAAQQWVRDFHADPVDPTANSAPGELAQN